MVAPRVGAWIETSVITDLSQAKTSRPAWARGLKLAVTTTAGTVPGRAPRGRVD